MIAHNVHVEKTQRIQEGGTCMLMLGEMINFYDQAQLGWDILGFGRWVVITLRGRDHDEDHLWIQPMW